MTHLVILESMWGWRDPGSAGRRAPQWFPINPENHSGKRLHRLLGADPEERSVWVTNACPGIQRTARDHGDPDPVRLRANIVRFPSEISWLLIGGKVAKQTLGRAATIDKDGFGDIPAGAMREKLAGANALFMPHPAARFWSKVMEGIFADFLAAPPSLAGVPLMLYYQPGPPEHTFRRIGERAWEYEFKGKKP